MEGKEGMEGKVSKVSKRWFRCKNPAAPLRGCGRCKKIWR